MRPLSWPTAGSLNNKGLICFESRDLDAALESYDAALALDPESVDVNFNKALPLLL